LFVFKRRDALDAVFFAARRECCFHARARVDVVLNSDSRRERMRSAGADEARVVETHHDHDSVSDDPLVDCAQRDLSRQRVAILTRLVQTGV
jgi:hypothetical protein